MNATDLMIGMLLGCIGGGYFVYGKKQANISALVAGILLCVLPYFLTQWFLLSLVSLFLMASPFLVHKYL